MQQPTVDRAASKAALLKDGNKLKHWARRHDFSDDTVKAYFYGRFSDSSQKAKEIVAALEADGYLRHVDPLYAMAWY